MATQFEYEDLVEAWLLAEEARLNPIDPSGASAKMATRAKRARAKQSHPLFYDPRQQ